MSKRTRRRQTRPRQEGFPGQQIAVTTPSALEHVNSLLIDGLLPTAAGYFPRAEGHYVRRKSPIHDAIFLLCLEGEGWIEVGNVCTMLKPGDIGYVPQSILHAYGANSNHPWSLVWFHITGDRVSEAASLLGLTLTKLVARVDGLGKDLPMIDELCHLLRPPHQLARFRMASTLVRDWFARASCRMYLSIHEASLIERIENSVNWMRSNLDRPIRLSELAGQAQLSVSRYSEIFRQLYDKPPIAFCTSCRISRAIELLTTTDHKISMIATQAGYTDPLHFSRVFRREMGLSPRQYRNDLRSRSDR